MNSSAASRRECVLPDTSFSATDDDWLLWCRLCAKDNSQRNVSVLSAANDEGGIEMSLTTAIQKYFWVNINRNEDLPQLLCTDCIALVTSLVNFGKRVCRVQEMFRSLHNSNVRTKSDLDAARLKYELLDEDHDHVLEQQSLPEAHYFDEKLKINGLNENELQMDVTLKNPLELPCCKVEIEKENILEEVENNENVLEISFISDAEVDKGFRKNKASCKVIINAKDRETKDIKKSVKNSKKSLLLGGDDSPKSKARKWWKEKSAGVNLYTCTECPRKFLRRDHYRRHMERVHSKIEPLPVKSKELHSCPYCDKQFSTNFQLQSHNRYVHMKERPFICEECGKALFTITALNTHKLTHTDYAPFECELCQKRFKDKVRLKRHLETHDPSKHICAVCGLELNSRITLNQHLLVHSDKMEHKCDYCGRAFKHSKSLKSHLILHAGLKPYSCDFCDRTFADGSNCRSHKKKAHPEELAALEASGAAKPYTLNIPKLEALKAVTKAADNLTPVVSKQSGRFLKLPKNDRSRNSRKQTKATSAFEDSIGSSNDTSLPDIPILF